MLRRKLSESRLLLEGMGIFTIVVGGIVGFYAIRDGGFRVYYSISRYVGREAWSAILFLVCNIVMAGCVWKYALEAREKYGKAWLIIMGLMIACFIALSLCPLGLFDAEYGQYGPVSIIHQITSRGMFALMAVLVGMMAWRRRGERRFLIPSILYIGYAILCVILSVATKVFWDLNFVFESAYIYLFYVILML